MTLVASLASSPLQALGSLAGGFSADELRTVAFQPGSDALDPAEEEKLSKLAAALLQRPALLLQIEATVDKAVDGPALSRGESLLELARKRGEAVQERLTDQGKVEPDRVYVIKEVIETEPTDGPVRSVLSVRAP
jgi:outer membrane protein OmpA-like peptidoglycan-associated protein